MKDYMVIQMLQKIHEESITISARGTIGYVCLRLEPYVPIVRLISIIPNKKSCLQNIYTCGH